MCKIIGILGGDSELQRELKNELVNLLKDSKYKVDASPYGESVNPNTLLDYEVDTNTDFYIVYNNTNIRNFFELSESHDLKIVNFSDFDISVLKELKDNIIYTIDELDVEEDVENIFDKII